MSKQIMLFAGCLLLAFSLQAQEEVPILLTSSYKTVKYAPEKGARFARIKATKSLDAKGVLKLGGKSTAKVYCNGAFRDLEGKGEYLIADLFARELEHSAMGFSNTFNDMLMAAIGGSRGSDSIPASDGWGNKKFDIVSRTPIGKAVAGQKLRFQWASREALPQYEFILEDESGKVLHSATVSETIYTADLGALGLKKGKYAWKVVKAGGEGPASNKYFFSVTGEDEKARAMKALQDEEGYQQADPLMKKLMEAAWLEDSEFYYAADMAYKEAAQMADEGALSRKMYEAFMARRAQ